MSKKPTIQKPVNSKPKIGVAANTVSNLAKPKVAAKVEEKKVEQATRPASAKQEARPASSKELPRAASAKQSIKPVEEEIPNEINKPKEIDLKEMISLIFDNDHISNPCFAIIDETTRVSAFMRHRDVNYINCLEKESLETERVRLAIIGAIRNGKPLVFDLMESDSLLENLEQVCSELDPTLFDELCNRSIVKEEKYMKIVKPDQDGDDYKPFCFVDEKMKNFNTVFLIEKNTPSEKFLKLGNTFRII